MRLELPYGQAPYPVDLVAPDLEIVGAAPLPPFVEPIEQTIARALAAPIGSGSLRSLVPSRGRVTVIVSDATRDEPRAAMVAAVRRELPDAQLTIALATGTHGPTALDRLGIDAFLAGARVVNHDGHRDDDLVLLGTTARGTPVRLHRCVVETDLVVATGCIRPHYFAGFGAGSKAIFPGLGAASDIRRNHQLKILPGSRAGEIDANPCRADLDEAVSLLGTPAFLLNVVAGPDGPRAAVGGQLDAAFRAGVELCRPWFTVRARRAPLVIASDGLPVTATLYQAAKIFAAALPLVAEGGKLIVVAECCDGLGPLDVVNEAVFRIGVVPRVPAGATIALVSGLSSEVVGQTLAEFAPRVSVAGSERVVVIPRASQLICEPTS